MVRSWFLTLVLVGLFVNLVGSDATVAQESVVISPDVVLNGAGDNVDTIAFWTGATPEETLMFVTSKADSLIEVWRFPFVVGNEAQPLRHESFGDSQVNGVVVDQQADKLYVSVAEPAGVVGVFSLPDLAFEQVLVQAALGEEPGIALYKWADGRSWLYTTGDERNLIYIRDADSGDEVLTFDIGREIETVWPDEYHGVVYVPDENGMTGVYAYTPEMETYERNGRSVFGPNAFQKDAEGIFVYACQTDGQDNGNGFIVISDQRKPTSEFEFFDRVSWDYLGNLQLTGVGNTDGIASLQTSLPGYPMGVFAAINDDTDTAVVGWDKIFAAMGLSCDRQMVAPAAELAVVEQVAEEIVLEGEVETAVVEPTAPAADPATTAATAPATTAVTATENTQTTAAQQTEAAPLGQETLGQESSSIPDWALLALGALIGGILVLLAVIVGSRLRKSGTRD